jgi:hypothetical protein
MKNHPSLLANPDDPGSAEEIRAFALLLAPIYELEWQRAVTSPKPNWNYVRFLHMRLVQFEQGDL